MLFGLLRKIINNRAKRLNFRSLPEIMPEQHLGTKANFPRREIKFTSISNDEIAQNKALTNYYDQGFFFKNKAKKLGYFKKHQKN